MTIPVLKSATLFNAESATKTVYLYEDGLGQSPYARSIHLEINGGSTPNWTLDIQGRVSNSATWHNIDYFRTDQGAAVSVSASQLTVNWTTAQHYVIPNPPPFVRLVGVRTGGTLTVYGSFSSEAYSTDFPTVAVIPGTGATNLGKAEDAAHTSGDVGVMLLAVRKNTATALAADGDYIPVIVDTNGALHINQATLLQGESENRNRLMTMPAYSYFAPIVADAQIISGAGILHTITIAPNDAAPTAGTIDIYDSLTASGTKVFSWTLTTAVFSPFTIVLDCILTTGLYIDFTTTGDVNVSGSYLAGAI